MSWITRVFWFAAFGCPLMGAGAGVDVGQPMKALLEQTCLDCHDSEMKEGNLSLEEVSLEINEHSAKAWLKSLEQLERGFMPPPKKAQLTKEEREAVVLDLEKRLVTYYKEVGHRNPAVLRRLNQAEYRNTVRDLFQMELGDEDPAKDFPADQLSHGFASNGEELVTSNFLFQKQLEAAESVVSRAIHFEEKPKRKQLLLKPPFDRTTRGQIYGDADLHKKVLKEPQPFQSFYTRPHGLPLSGYHPVDELNDGVAVSGRYRIRLQVEAKHRHKLDQSKFKRFPSMWDEREPLRLSMHTGTLKGIDVGNKEAREFALNHQQGSERLLATWDLPDDQLVWLECEVWLDEGSFPRFTFPNGPTDSNNRLLTYFKDNAEVLLQGEALEAYRRNTNNWTVFRLFESPRIHLHQIEVDGPIVDEWPPESHRLVFGEELYRSEKAEEVLSGFASRAWRRPVEPGEMTPIIELVRSAEKSGVSAELAVQEGIKAILCAPGFLYREERGEKLNAYELATRLSYFLTASMPDEKLMQRAKLGQLELRNEAQRLLAGAGVDGLIEEFLNGWLHMRKLGSMSPDVHKFSVYYSDQLEPAMREETRLYFKQLLATNDSIMRLLDADYVMVNRALAELYGLNFEVEGKEEVTLVGLSPQDLRQDGAGHAPSLSFARVPTKDRLRGGLLGQASVLTLTANGVDTSPIIRGVWLLENILGTPPSPPPPNIPVIEPDIRGATTIRDQLEKHRSSRACSSCHAHIDPPGFALESFDPIGRWRGHYLQGSKPIAIDPSGHFGGSEFKDVLGFKDILLQQSDQFARNLVEKLLIHALGRELEVTDRPHIREILAKNREKQYPLRDLVLDVIESPVFGEK